MIFGDIGKFAIEIEFHADIDEWMFGKVSYSVSGDRVGNGQSTSIRDFYSQMPSIIKLANERNSKYLFSMDRGQCFSSINDGIFGNPDAHQGNYLPFSILPAIDAFDTWRVFLVESGGVARLLYANDPYLSIGELCVSGEAVEKCLLDAFYYLNDAYESLNKK